MKKEVNTDRKQKTEEVKGWQDVAECTGTKTMTGKLWTESHVREQKKKTNVGHQATWHKT